MFGDPTWDFVVARSPKGNDHELGGDPDGWGQSEPPNEGMMMRGDAKLGCVGATHRLHRVHYRGSELLAAS